MRPTFAALTLVLGLAAPLAAQGNPGQPGAGQAPHPDPLGGAFFPPELVMRYQTVIDLQDNQRATLQQAIQQAQSVALSSQFKLGAEGEKLAKLIQGNVLDETAVLEQVDHVLAAEREVKRAQIGLLVRIKNTLTPAQQAKLRELRGATQ